MRKSMRPITLSRIAETAFYAQKIGSITSSNLAEFLNIKMRRSKELLDGMVELGFLEIQNKQYKPTKNCGRLLIAIRKNQWQEIHEIMMKNQFYSAFYNTTLSMEPATKEQLLERLYDSDVHFNQTTVSVLCDWGERLGTLQRNVTNSKYYTIFEGSKSILKEFLASYDLLNKRIGPFLKQRYVEIPMIREMVCQNMRISRKLFDKLFVELYLKNIGKLELSGAPFTTHAKKSKKKVKNITYSEIPEKLTMILSSNEYLNGITIDKKQYYYVAYHGGEINE